MEFPGSPDSLTAEWLTGALRETGALERGRVVSFDAQVLGGAKGASGQLVRIRLTYDAGAHPDAPRSLIAKFSAADPQSRAMIHALGIYEREVRFYQDLAPLIALRTPRRYHADIRMDTGACVLLLEDLAPARNGDRAAGCSLAQAERIVRECGMLDVASFLGGNVSIADRRAHEMDLLRTYHALLVENGVGDYTFEQCLDDYRLAMFDGFFRMVLFLGSGDPREEQLRTHRDVICPRFCAAVVDLDAGALLHGTI